MLNISKHYYDCQILGHCKKLQQTIKGIENILKTNSFTIGEKKKEN